MSGRKTPTWIVPLAMSLLVALFGWWGTGRLRQTVENQLKDELAATLEANVTALEIWMKNQGKLANALAQDPQVRELALRSLARAEVVAEGEGRRPPDQPEFEELTTYLKPRLTLLGFDLIRLVSTNHLNLGTSPRRRSRGWTPVYDEHVEKYSELFSSGQPVIITPFKPKRPRFGGRPGVEGANRRAPHRAFGGRLPGSGPGRRRGERRPGSVISP